MPYDPPIEPDYIEPVHNTKTETGKLRALLWASWYELNVIRARDGAPVGVDENYFSGLVDAISDALGEDTKPWPSKEMKQYLNALAPWSDTPKTETAWLIERGQAVHHSPIIWWKGGPHHEYERYGGWWTEHADTALRFKTKEAADKAARAAFNLFDWDTPSYSITEHVFIR